MTTTEMNRFALELPPRPARERAGARAVSARPRGAARGERLAAFKMLLEYGDDELWALVSGRRECGDPALGEVVQCYGIAEANSPGEHHGSNEKSHPFLRGGQVDRVSGVVGQHRSRRRRHPNPLREDGDIHLRPRVRPRRAAARKSPISTATRVCSSTAAIRSSSSRVNAISSRFATCSER